MATFLGIFGAPIAKVLVFFLDALIKRFEGNAKAKAAFLEIVQFLNSNKLVSLDLHESYQNQYRANDAEVEEILRRRQPPP